MPTQLSNFFSARGYLNNIPLYRISNADLGTARTALKYDIDSFFINGLISLTSAITSIKKNSYSWTFIQSYYTLFYFARAFNGINDYAVVYKESKPYSIKIQPAEGFVKLKGNSHDVVLTQFKTHLASDILLSSTIENMSPVDWFNAQRNLINYTLNPQTDPLPPINLFQYKNEFRKWVSTYINDSAHNYTFDPSHCYLAYPLQLFFRIYKYYSDNNLKIDCLDDERIDFFRTGFSDEKGTMSTIFSKIIDLYD